MLEVISRLQDPNEKTRARAGYRLSTIGDEQVVPYLLAALSDSNAKVRRQVTFALSVLHPAQAVSSLINALQDSDTEVRRRAALALGKIGDPAAVEPLISAFHDPDRRPLGLRYSAQRALMRLGKPAVVPLIMAYEDSDADIRAQAVYTLGRIGDPQAIDVFIRALDDPDQWIRWMAAAISKHIYDERTIGKLIMRLDDEFMGGGAAYTLGIIGGEESIDPLTEAINNPKQYNAIYVNAMRMIAQLAVQQIRYRLCKEL